MALQRIDRFLGMPEPPPAVHMRAKKKQRQQQPVAAADGAAVNGVPHTNGIASSAAAAPGGASSDGGGSGSSESGVVECDLPDGYVELGGADYDWITNMQEMAAQVCLWCDACQTSGGCCEALAGCLIHELAHVQVVESPTSLHCPRCRPPVATTIV